MPQDTPDAARSPVQSAVTTYVYRFYRQDGTLLYVGVTNDLNSRFVAHQGKPWWAQASHSKIDAHGNRALALAAEAMAILEENPVHNVQRPTRARAEQLQARALGDPVAGTSPYDPVAVLERAHDRIAALEADLRKVRGALTSVSAERDELAAAARAAEARHTRTQQVAGMLREQLAGCRAELKLAEGRAGRAEKLLKTARLKRFVAGIRD